MDLKNVNAHLSLSGNLIDRDDLIQHLWIQEGMSHELKQKIIVALQHYSSQQATHHVMTLHFMVGPNSFSLTRSINYRLDVHPTIICTHNSLNVIHHICSSSSHNFMPKSYLNFNQFLIMKTLTNSCYCIMELDQFFLVLYFHPNQHISPWVLLFNVTFSLSI
jgi:hypothetical protein